MELEVLTNQIAVGPYVNAVVSLADSNRDSLGFLPKSAYEELAARQRLYIAVAKDSRSFLGYLLFGGRYPHVRIFQLFTDPSQRNQDVGSKLISHLKAAVLPWGIQTITARVAADLPANDFWEKQGFHLLQQVSGGRTTDRLINIRTFEVPAASLWTTVQLARATTQDIAWTLRDRPTLEVPHYVLDLNVFFDVIRDRMDSDIARRVIAAAMSNDIRVSVTSEFEKELQRHSRDPNADPVLRFAQSLPTLPTIENRVLQPLIENLRTILIAGKLRTGRNAPNDTSDLFHLASCIHHRMTGFLTRELAILGKADVLRKRFGLEVTSPIELLGDLDDEASERIGVVANVGSHELTVQELNEGHRVQAETFLVKMGLDDANIASILDPGTTSRHRYRLELRANDDLVGLASWAISKRPAKEAAAYLIIDEVHPLSTKAIDHVLQTILDCLPSNEFWKLRLEMALHQAKTRETALNRGFLTGDATHVGGSLSALWRFAYKGLITDQQWQRFCDQVKQATGATVSGRSPKFEEACNTGVVFTLPNRDIKAMRLFDLETAFSPLTAC